MFYVYLLKTEKSGKLYIGRTTNLFKRIREHNLGLVKSTKAFNPWKLVYYESYYSSQDAEDRESKLKQFGKVYSQLKRRIHRSIHPD